jgi:hypothetical protein
MFNNRMAAIGQPVKAMACDMASGLFHRLGMVHADDVESAVRED